MKEVDISKMKEDRTYKTCPYCGEPEPVAPGYQDALDKLKEFEGTILYWTKHAELMENIPIDKWYEVNGKKYPFDANMQHMNDAYAKCHYGVSIWWNKIHCCSKCKKEYYTIHEH